MLYAVIFLSLLLCLVAVILFIDAVPVAIRWYERIGTGGFADAKAYTEKTKKIAMKWLLKMPAVKISDNSRLTIIERVRGNYKSKRIQSWQEASLLLGLDSFSEDGETSDVIKKYLRTRLNENGEWREFVESPDFAMLGYAVMMSPEADLQTVRPAMDRIYRYLIDKAGSGTVPYNAKTDVRFVDTVGMICPFLFKYASVYGVPQASELAMKQIAEYAEHGMNEKFFVPMHCYNVTTLAPLGVCGWGRGCGWFAEGLADSIPNANAEYAAELLEIAKKFADSMTAFQLPNGAWSRQIFAENIGESSATAMLGYFMKSMYGFTGDERYKKSADSAQKFLMSVTRRNGKLDNAQGDTKGIGFYSLTTDIMPAAQGFAFRQCFMKNSDINLK